MKEAGPNYFTQAKIITIASGKAIARAGPSIQAAVALLAARRFGRVADRLKGKTGQETWNVQFLPGYSQALIELMRFLFRRRLPYSDEDLCEITEHAGLFPTLFIYMMPHLDGLVRNLEQHASAYGVSPRMAKAMQQLKTGLGRCGNTPESRLRGRVVQLLKRASPAAKNLPTRRLRKTSAGAPRTQSTFERIAAAYIPPPTDEQSPVPQFCADPADPDRRLIERLNKLFRDCARERGLTWRRSRLKR